MGVILFGEGYGSNTTATKGYSDDFHFALFDVYIPEKDLWMQRHSIEDIAEYFNIKPVPIIMTGKIQEAVDFVMTKPKSTLSENALMEGLVGRPAIEILDRQGRRVLIKIKAKYF